MGRPHRKSDSGSLLTRLPVPDAISFAMATDDDVNCIDGRTWLSLLLLGIMIVGESTVVDVRATANKREANPICSGLMLEIKFWLCFSLIESLSFILLCSLLGAVPKRWWQRRSNAVKGAIVVLNSGVVRGTTKASDNKGNEQQQHAATAAINQLFLFIMMFLNDEWYVLLINIMANPRGESFERRWQRDLSD